MFSKVLQEIRKILSEETPRNSGAVSPEGGNRQCHNESTWPHLEPEKQPVPWLPTYSLPSAFGIGAMNHGFGCGIR